MQQVSVCINYVADSRIFEIVVDLTPFLQQLGFRCPPWFIYSYIFQKGECGSLLCILRFHVRTCKIYIYIIYIYTCLCTYRQTCGEIFIYQKYVFRIFAQEHFLAFSFCGCTCVSFLQTKLQRVRWVAMGCIYSQGVCWNCHELSSSIYISNYLEWF